MVKSHMSNNKVTYPSDHAVTWGQVANEFHFTFILRSLLPLNLTGWWLLINLDDGLSMVGFSVSHLIFTQLKKFIRWRFFIPKLLSFLHQFHPIPEKHLSEPSCFKSLGSQSGKKVPDQHYGKNSFQEFKHDPQNVSNWK